MRRLSASFVPLLITTFLLNPLGGALAHADAPKGRSFAELVRNTKEADSILLKSEDLTDAETFYPSADLKIQAALSDAFLAVASSLTATETSPAPAVCEPLVLSRLQSEITSRGLPADPSAMRFAILLLRQKNLIDDITLYPLLAAFPAWAEVGYVEKEWIRKDAQGRTATAECPTDQFIQMVAGVRAAKGRKMGRRDIRDHIDASEKVKNDTGEPRFLPAQIIWLRTLERTRFDQETTFALGTVLDQIAEAKDSSPRADPRDSPTKVMSKRKKKARGLSNRLALYSRYNGLQIKQLADEFKTFTERMDLFSSDAKIVIHYKDGRPDEVYTLSPEEQYRMAAKMLHKEVEALRNSGLFIGRTPSFDDVIIASVETGFVRASELDAAMGVDNVWNPRVSGWAKVMSVVKKYGSTSLILIPTPYTFWASLVLTLAETLVQKKTQGPGNADDNGISIF